MKRLVHIDCECKACIAQANAANATMGLKRCTGCRITKSLSEFHKREGTRNGFQSYCKLCGNARVWASLRNLTTEDFKAMLEAQGERCASCGDPFGDSKPMIDHDHSCCPGRKSCGKCVRALVCRYCNTALGMINDDPDKAMALAAYLLRYQDVLTKGVVA